MAQVTQTTNYIGRFAPSPSGPLHFGSTVAALASFLQARSQNGRWLVRIDDIDPPREQPGAARSIVDTLAALGLEWDGPITYQNARADAYDEALRQLATRGLTFRCACSRKQLKGRIYPGTCRDGMPNGAPVRSTRARIQEREISFTDRLQGLYTQNLARDVGDFVLRRADGLYGYHLAVVVDDATSGITEIVRGVDLLDSTPRQIYLQSLLGLSTPAYCHIPVVLDANGVKLSKQSFAAGVDPKMASSLLIDALKFLQQQPPPELVHHRLGEILDWAISHWNILLIGKQSRSFTICDSEI